MFLGNVWDLSCRSCLFASASNRLFQQFYQHHNIRTCFSNKRATHFFRSWRPAPQTDLLNLQGRILVENVTVWNAKGIDALDSEMDNGVADIGTLTA